MSTSSPTISSTRPIRSRPSGAASLPCWPLRNTDQSSKSLINLMAGCSDPQGEPSKTEGMYGSPSWGVEGPKVGGGVITLHHHPAQWDEISHFKLLKR